MKCSRAERIEMDYEPNWRAILIRFLNNLRSEISEEKSAFRVQWVIQNRLNGLIADDDIVESKGYYSGLRTAQEILQKVACSVHDEEGLEDDCSDCPFQMVCFDEDYGEDFDG